MSDVWRSLTVRSNAPWVMVTSGPPSPCEQTNVIENITFPQLRWRSVKISFATPQEKSSLMFGCVGVWCHYFSDLTVGCGALSQVQRVLKNANSCEVVRKHWRIQVGRYGCTPVQFLTVSCSFRQLFCQIGWRPTSGVGAPSRVGNPGSTTGKNVYAPFMIMEK